MVLCRLLAALVAAAVLGGCSLAPATKVAERVDDRPVRVVTTVNFLTEAVREIGGPDVTVEPLMGPGVDPHLYKASAGDVRTLRDADVILYGGIELEGKMGDLLDELAERQRTVALFEAIPRDRLLREPGKDVTDPHVWFDPVLWLVAVDGVERALAAASPARAGDFARRADAYRAKVRRTADEARRLLAGVPRERRVVITSHDAFQYLGRAFGYDVVAIQGISTAAEATTGDIQRVADVAVRRGLGSVFVESSVPRQTIEAVVAAARRGGQDLRVGGELLADAAGEDERWTTMLLENATTIARGLR